jgi:membrane protein involved in colicin uptake
LGLAGARLPISVAEHLSGRAGIDISGLPPIAAYDAIEAQAKMVIGRWLDDDDLVREGEQQESARRHRNGARYLSDQAEEIREEAEEELDQRVSRAERSRDQVRQRTEERKEEIRRQEEQAKKEARAKARKREEAVRQAAKVQEKATEAKERQAELARIRAESEALRKESEAVEAERVVTAIDEHLEAKKSSGRNGSSAPAR